MTALADDSSSSEKSRLVAESRQDDDLSVKMEWRSVSEISVKMNAGASA
jgi:hypothetical protein